MGRIPLSLLAALVSAGALAQATIVGPSEAHLRQLAFDHYPAVMGREGLQERVIIGFVLDRDFKVVRHSVAMPKRGETRAPGSIRDMFPKLDEGTCAAGGLTSLRAPRGVNGQFDQGVFAAWCVLR